MRLGRKSGDCEEALEGSAESPEEFEKLTPCGGRAAVKDPRLCFHLPLMVLLTFGLALVIHQWMGRASNPGFSRFLSPLSTSVNVFA